MTRRVNKNTMRRYREVRDLHNELRKKYRADVVCNFLVRNYFFNKEHIYHILEWVDDKPVEGPSMIYEQVMNNDDFKL